MGLMKEVEKISLSLRLRLAVPMVFNLLKSVVAAATTDTRQGIGRRRATGWRRILQNSPTSKELSEAKFEEKKNLSEFFDFLAGQIG
jgi:hypothetical protein